MYAVNKCRVTIYKYFEQSDSPTITFAII